MKIEFDSSVKKNFLNIDKGDIFTIAGKNENIFIKTDEIYDSDEDMFFNAVDLKNGNHESFKDDANIILIQDYTFKIKNFNI